MPACRVEFHTGLPDPLGFACRLLRKAQRQGHRLLVTAPSARLAELDGLLWTFEPESFVAHVRLPGAPPELLPLTPVWLSEAVPAGEVPPLLVNIGAAVPPALEPFQRIIELVSHEVDEAQAGRERWRAYKAMGQAWGIEIVHHRVGAVGGARE